MRWRWHCCADSLKQCCACIVWLYWNVLVGMGGVCFVFIYLPAALCCWAGVHMAK